MIPAEKQVIDLSQAQKIKELKFNLDTQYCWYVDNNYPSSVGGLCNKGSYYYDPYDVDWEKGELLEFPALNVAELAIALPGIVYRTSFYNLLIWRVGVGWGVDYFNSINEPLINRWAGENLAHTMGDRLIWLADQKLINPQEISL